MIVQMHNEIWYVNTLFLLKHNYYYYSLIYYIIIIIFNVFNIYLNSELTCKLSEEMAHNIVQQQQSSKIFYNDKSIDNTIITTTTGSINNELENSSQFKQPNHTTKQTIEDEPSSSPSPIETKTVEPINPIVIRQKSLSIQQRLELLNNQTTNGVGLNKIIAKGLPFNSPRPLSSQFTTVPETINTNDTESAPTTTTKTKNESDSETEKEKEEEVTPLSPTPTPKQKDKGQERSRSRSKSPFNLLDIHKITNWTSIGSSKDNKDKTTTTAPIPAPRTTPKASKTSLVKGFLNIGNKLSPSPNKQTLISNNIVNINQNKTPTIKETNSGILNFNNN
jgi:hypothetical protein